MSKERILVIDDDAYIRNACSDFLLSEGYAVSSAESGEKGIELLRKSDFELVLTDFKMPGMDGLEVLKNVKAISPDTDVIIITAHGSIENAVAAMRQGAYDYITKDFDILELELIVKRCLEKQRLSAQVSELKEVVNLYEASKAINSLMDMDELLNLILKLLCDTLGCSGGSIMLYNDETNELSVRVADGPRKDSLIGKKIVIDKAGSDINKSFLMSGPLRNDARFNPDSADGMQPGIAVPLERKGNLIGIINLQRRDQDAQFSKRDEFLLSIFAAEAAVAIENIYLFNSLEHEKEELNALFTNMADGSVAMDTSFGIVRMNHAAQALLGINFSESAGKAIIGFLTDFTPSLPWSELMATSERTVQFELSRSKGKSLYLGIVANKIFDRDNKPAGYIWVLRDVTEEKHEEKHKNDFLSLITHKLKTPLTTIIGYSPVLLERIKDPDERIVNALNSIKKQGELLNDLVDSLVRFTALDSDIIQLDLDFVPLKDIMDVWKRKYSDVIEDNNASLTIDESVEKLPPLYVDRKKIIEVIDSLIKNAIKFNDRDKKEVRITARVEDPKTALIEISDNGNGIPSEEYSKIFKKFYQIDEFDTGQVRGMGLGLALVKRVVEIHGGKIWVKSLIGEGSTFSLTLPTYFQKD
jgi:PAS domain S-box-containing protein